MKELVKFHRIDRLYAEHKDKILEIVNRVYTSGKVLQGAAVEELERRIALMCQRKYGIALGSCTDALSLSLMANGIGNGEEVLVTPFTFPASYTCIERVEAIPVMTPVNDETFMTELQGIKKLVTDRTSAWIVVNVFGSMMNMDMVEEIAFKDGIYLIEDAAQSFTSDWADKPAGSFGDVSCLSFDPTKILPAFATGGMALTNEHLLADNIKYYRYKNRGCNSQMSSLTASLLLYWLDFLPEWESKRKDIASYYRVALEGVKEITLPFTHPLSKHIWHKFVIKAKKRNELKQYLLKHEIETKIHYEPNDEALSLPIYPHLRAEEQREVIHCIKRFYSSHHSTPLT